jgi:hypothetical protein
MIFNPPLKRTPFEPRSLSSSRRRPPPRKKSEQDINYDEGKTSVLSGIDQAIRCTKPAEAYGALIGLRRRAQQVKSLPVPNTRRDKFHKDLDALILAIKKNQERLFRVYKNDPTFLRNNAKFTQLYAQTYEMSEHEKGWCLALSMYWLAACKNDARDEYWNWIRTEKGIKVLREIMREQDKACRKGIKEQRLWQADFHKALPKIMTTKLNKESPFAKKLVKKLAYKDEGRVYLYLGTDASEGLGIVDKFIKKQGFHSIGCSDLSDKTGHELGCYIRPGRIEVFDPNMGVVLIEKDHQRAFIEFLNLGGLLLPGHQVAFSWHWYQ